MTTMKDVLRGSKTVDVEVLGGTDRSATPNVVEYAVQSMFKGQTIAKAAKSTAKKLSGFENMFLGPGVTIVTPRLLEEALWERLVDQVIAGIPRIKAGKEHYALGGVITQFSQPASIRAELKRRVVQKLGYDPFQSDDGT